MWFSFEPIIGSEISSTLNHRRQIDCTQRCLHCDSRQQPYARGGIQIDNLSRADRAELVTILYHDIDFSAIKELLAKVFIHKNQDRSKHVTRYVADYLRLIIKEPVQGQVDGESFIFPEIDMTFNLATYPFILPTPRSAY